MYSGDQRRGDLVDAGQLGRVRSCKVWFAVSERGSLCCNIGLGDAKGGRLSSKSQWMGVAWKLERGGVRKVKKREDQSRWAPTRTKVGKWEVLVEEREHGSPMMGETTGAKKGQRELTKGMGTE